MYSSSKYAAYILQLFLKYIQFILFLCKNQMIIMMWLELTNKQVSCSPNAVVTGYAAFVNWSGNTVIRIINE